MACANLPLTMTPPRVIVIGSANVDLCMRLPSLPSPGETLGGGVFTQAFGGKGANSAVGAAQAGAATALVGCVGMDSLGDLMVENLRKKEVALDFMARRSEQPTGTAVILLDGKAQNMIGVAPGANDLVTPARLNELRGELAKADIIIVQNEIPAETVTRLLEIAAEEHLKILYNAAPARHIPHTMMNAVQWLVVNESEASILSAHPVNSTQDAEMAAQALIKMGAKNVLVTLGASGVYVTGPEGAFHLPAFRVTPVDTVAAGDIFCGALAVALAENSDLKSSVRFASAAAAISVTRRGAQDSAPRRTEIEDFLKSRE